MKATNRIYCFLCILLLTSSGAIAQNLTRAEYFFDTDVGLGTATPITITTGTDIDFTTDIPLTGLQAGYHTLFIRFANEDNVWGHYESRTVYIQPNMEFTDPELVGAEYFFDTDPGIGSGTPIGFTAGMEVDFTTDIPTTGLEPGYHTLFIRFVDENGLWGHLEGRTVYVQLHSGSTTPVLAGAEYFYDTDPGIGNGSPISITSGMEVDFTAELPTSGLDPGYHTLFIRFMDENGLWGHTEGRTVYVQSQSSSEVPELIAAEYFFDTDPGIGNGTSIPITPGVDINFTADISTTGLESGYHTLFIRFMDENELWGHFEARTIYVQPNVSSQTFMLSDAEYFIDTDPGIGNGTPIVFAQGNKANFTLDVPTTGFTQGSSHTIFVRFMNEDFTWGIYEYGEFTVEGCLESEPEFSFENTCVNGVVTFTDQSTNLYPETTYAWDMDNDGTAEYTTLGDITHTYTEAGIYEVRLQLTNPGGCTKMQLHQIEIYPSYTTALFDTICQGETFNYRGIDYTETGEYIHNLTSINGCDSIVTLNLTVNPIYYETDEVTICQHDSYTFGSQTLTEAGVYEEIFQSVLGCDSTVTLTLNITPVFNVTDETSICFGDEYIFGTQTLNETGEYTEIFTSVGGCDSTVVLTLTVNPVYNETDEATICQGDEYIFGTQTLTDAGEYTEVFQSVYGCDSTVVLTLTVNSRYNETDEATICQGEVYTLGTQLLTESGEYTEVFQSALGCDSTVVLTLTVNPTYHITVDESICQGETFTFNGVDYTETGQYVHHLVTILGCDSIVTLDLTVNPIYNIALSNTICDGEEYKLGTQTLTESGEYTEVFQSILGCDSTVVLTLTVLPPYNEVASVAICEGHEYILGTQTLTEAGEFTEVFQSVHGCDSTVVLTLTVNPVYHIDVENAICQGDEYIFGTQTLTDVGEYTEVFQSVHGCDSTVVLTLTVNPTYNETDKATICEGDEYIFGSQTLTHAGEYTEVFQSILGCDSTVVLTLTVNPTYHITVDNSICQGETFTFNGVDYAESGEYIHSFETILGCDSIVTLDLSVHPVYNEVASAAICEGDEYIFGMQTLTEAGEFTEVFQSVHGCDSTVVLTLTVNPVYNIEVEHAICQGDEYIFGTQTLTDAGEFTEVFQSVHGCDSTVVLTLTVNPIFNETDEATICQGDEYIFGSQTLTDTGEYTEIFQSILGCDSTVVLTLTVNPTYHITVGESICQGETFTFNGVDYAESGEYIHSFETILGCDSIVTLDLTVNPIYNIALSNTICEGEEYQLGTQTLTESGEYTEVFQSVHGCDSTVVLTLTVNPVYFETDEATICQGDEYIFGTQTLTDAGEYTEVFQSVHGCDSTVVLTLTVNPTYNETDKATICEGDEYIFGSQTLTDAGEYTEVFQSILGCDSTVVLTLTVNPTYHITVDESICEGETFTFNGVDYAESGEYIHSFETILGCDSIVTLDLSVHPVYNEVASAAICEGDEYIFGMQTLTEGGEFTEVFQSVHGCDSTVVLTLTVNPVYNIEVEHAICQGDEYIFGTQTLTDAGEYTEVFQSVHGCDSTVVLTLTVNPTYNETDKATICQGEEFIFGTQTLTESGEFTEVFQSVLGCDSTVVLTLTVNPTYHITVDESICEGETFTFNGVDYTETGKYVHHLETILGCDSIVTLDLSVHPVYNEVASAAICEGDEYIFGMQTLTEAGEFTEVFQSVHGCDSTVVLTLTVNPVYNIEVEHAICQGDEYIFGTQTLTDAGEYTEVFQSVHGCDSTVVLTLTVLPPYNEVASVAICEGHEYILGTQTLIEAGEFTEVFQSVHGCDSTVVLTLTVNPVYHIDVENAICQGDEYIFGSQTLTDAGEYTKVFQSALGCDSTVVLTLGVVEVDVSVSVENNILTANAINAEYQWLDCNNNFEPIQGATNQSFSPTHNGSFAVEVYYLGCSEMSDCIPINGLSVSTNTKGKVIEFYPNPSKGSVTIDVYEPVQLNIYSISGHLLLTNSLVNGKHEISLSHLPDGVYIIKVDNGKVITSSRLVIAR